MQRVFMPYWISRLDESMSVCINEFTWPGSFLCPSYSHPKDNYYHSIFCGEGGIVYSWYIFQWSYNLITMGGADFNTSTNMQTFGIIIWLTRLLWSTGKAVIMDSGLCAIKGLLEMSNRGVYWFALIKKR